MIKGLLSLYRLGLGHNLNKSITPIYPFKPYSLLILVCFYF